jgi:Protein of unknown function (DUF3618)
VADGTDRTAEDVQREIEEARASLAATVDQIAYRTNPKRIATDARHRLIERAQTPQAKAVLAAAAALATALFIARFVAARRHRDD